MSSMAKTLRNVCAIAAFVAWGCGGRTLDAEGTDDGSGSPDGGTTNTPAPACNEICRRAVDLCFPGAAITQCASDCETMRSQFKGCPGLDELLKCRLTSSVTCSNNTVTLEGCTAELNQVARCHP
jgi:hypothetical protein